MNIKLYRGIRRYCERANAPCRHTHATNDLPEEKEILDGCDGGIDSTNPIASTCFHDDSNYDGTARCIGKRLPEPDARPGVVPEA